MAANEPGWGFRADTAARSWGGTKGKIMLAIGMLEGWERYMPDLIRRAEATNSAVHVLEFAAPLGMGSFTSNPRPAGDAYLELSKPGWAIDGPRSDPGLVPEDAAEAAVEITAFLEAVTDFLRANGLEVTTAWLPGFDHAQMGEYARAHAVDTVALIRRGWWARLRGGDTRPLLKRQGLTVIDLKSSDPIQSEALEVSASRTLSETNSI
jgi:hypothetical protein